MKTYYPQLILLCLALASSAGAAALQSGKPAAITPDGGRYYGALVDGKLHGRGRIEWSNGNFYEGGFRDGLFSGHGVKRLTPEQVYKGEFRNGYMHGRGRLEGPDGMLYVGEFRHDEISGRGTLTDRDGVYKGEFRHSLYWGRGEMVYSDGRKYRGDYVRGRYHGKGRFETSDGEVYEGDFVQSEFTGLGTHTLSDGRRHEGRFKGWRAHGPGRFFDRHGNVYEGEFVDGELKGRGRVAGQGSSYEGEFRNWRFHGQGTLRLASGDVYTGAFENGAYHGEGTLTYAKPLADGRTKDSGTWRYGQLRDEKAEDAALRNAESALYGQRALLEKALSALAPRDPAKINMYLLAVAGDGTQEVFRREVHFVRDQFDRAFGTSGRSVALINSRTTVEAAPMATVTSIREALNAIAARMDRDKDVLFLFLTSHGSREHSLALGQNFMSLRGLAASELATLLRESGIRWKVVVVSACYSGGFIEPLRNDHTLVLTAARHDRQSFGCSDDNDFTYFGRAFFKEALPGSASFVDAFRKASGLVAEWEKKHATAPAGEKGGDDAGFSLPQMHAPAPAVDYLARWWGQLGRDAPAAARKRAAAP